MMTIYIYRERESLAINEEKDKAAAVASCCAIVKSSGRATPGGEQKRQTDRQENEWRRARER